MRMVWLDRPRARGLAFIEQNWSQLAIFLMLAIQEIVSVNVSLALGALSRQNAHPAIGLAVQAYRSDGRQGVYHCLRVVDTENP